MKHIECRINYKITDEAIRSAYSAVCGRLSCGHGDGAVILQ